MKVIVTGGAGYIGGHVVAQLLGRGDEVLVVDDLSSGRVDRIGAAHLVEIDLSADGSVPALTDAFRDLGADAVIHLAARKRVDESIAHPALYYRQNVGGLAAVVDAMEQAGVPTLVFSSSAAVYGDVHGGAVTEDEPCHPVNPYGRSKLVGEWLAQDAATAWGLASVSLRYFNVAGAAAPGLADEKPTNLIPIVLDRRARGLQPQVYGLGHGTPDGSGVRDYVHVVDLAEAHLAVLDRLHRSADRSLPPALNVGTGAGASVLEVVTAIGDALGERIVPEVVAARAGDPASVVADVSLIASAVGWRARHDLRDIVRSAVDTFPVTSR